MDNTTIELRKFCLEKAMEILSWYNCANRNNINIMQLSEYIYLYLTKGETNDYLSIINRRKGNSNMELK